MMPLVSSGGNHQEQAHNQDHDLDLRAQVRQLQEEEVERLRTERTAPLQELPPAYQSDVGLRVSTYMP
jgi:hypothetical protein